MTPEAAATVLVVVSVGAGCLSIVLYAAALSLRPSPGRDWLEWSGMGLLAAMLMGFTVAQLAEGREWAAAALFGATLLVPYVPRPDGRRPGSIEDGLEFSRALGVLESVGSFDRFDGDATDLFGRCNDQTAAARSRISARQEQQARHRLAYRPRGGAAEQDAYAEALVGLHLMGIWLRPLDDERLLAGHRRAADAACRISERQARRIRKRAARYRQSAVAEFGGEAKLAAQADAWSVAIRDALDDAERGAPR